MKYLKKLIKYFRAGNRSNGELYLRHLRKKGMRIGEGTVLFNPETTLIDETSPFMITIGKNAQITGGVTILSHDYGWSVLKANKGEVLGSIRHVSIGDNVYIGMNATILGGVRIGNNVIIGAGSLVSKDIPDNCVAVGNPCKPIYSLEEYYRKRCKAQLGEAVSIVKNYYDCYGELPKQDVLYEHFWLFTNEREKLPNHFVFQNNLMLGSEILTWDRFESHKPMFDGFDVFLKYAINNGNIL